MVVGMHIRFIISVISLFYIFFPPTSFAQTSYSVGVGNYDYYPYYGIEQQEFVGHARDVLDLFARKHNIQFEYLPYPFKRLLHLRKHGKLDFIYPDNPHWSSELPTSKKIYFSQPIVSYTDGLMVLPKNRHIPLKNIQRISTIRGFTLLGYLNKISSGEINVIENNNLHALITQTLLSRAQGTYVDVSVVNHYLNTEMARPKSLVFARHLPKSSGYYYLSSLTQSHLISKFNLFLVNEAVALEKLRQKYRIGEEFYVN